MQWGDNIDAFGLKVDERLTAHIDIASREYNERWYTDVKAWKIEREDSGSAPSMPDDEPFPEPPDTDDGDDGLPF